MVQIEYLAFLDGDLGNHFCDPRELNISYLLIIAYTYKFIIRTPIVPLQIVYPL